MVLTRARALAGGKVRRTESSRWAVSIRMSTKTYSTRKSWAEVSMGTERKQELECSGFGKAGGAEGLTGPRSLRSQASGFNLGGVGLGAGLYGSHGLHYVIQPAPSLFHWSTPNSLFNTCIRDGCCFQGDQSPGKIYLWSRKARPPPESEGPSSLLRGRKAL